MVSAMVNLEKSFLEPSVDEENIIKSNVEKVTKQQWRHSWLYMTSFVGRWSIVSGGLATIAFEQYPMV